MKVFPVLALFILIITLFLPYSIHLKEKFADDDYLRDLKVAAGYSVPPPSDEPITTYANLYKKNFGAYDWKFPGEMTPQEIKDVWAKERDIQLKNKYGEDSREYIASKLADSPKRTTDEIKKFMSLYWPFRNTEKY